MWKNALALIRFIGAMALIYMNGIIFIQVILRYFFDTGIIWSEESSRFAMIITVLLGAALAQLGGHHIRFTILNDLLPPAFKRGLGLISELSVAIAALLLIIYGFQLAYMNSAQSSLTMGISVFFIYIIIPISMLIMLIIVGLRIYRLLSGWDPDRLSPNELSEIIDHNEHT